MESTLEIATPPATRHLVLRGRYRVGERIGGGGMGDVFAGEDVRDGRQVAIKRLREAWAEEPLARARFDREIDAAAVRGAGLVEVLDAGLGPDGLPYLVMERLRGETLSSRLRRAGRLSPRRACRTLDGVLSGLSALHAAGIVHRDVKPANVFLDVRAGPKLIDLGVARAIGVPSQITEAGMVVGTPAFVSPEQLRGDEVGPRIDVYAAGVTLYQALCGALPFDVVGAGELFAAILAGAVVPLSSRVPELPPSLCAVVARAMAVPAAERYPSAAAMRRALARERASAPAGAPPPRLAAPPPPDTVLTRADRPGASVPAISGRCVHAAGSLLAVDGAISPFAWMPLAALPLAGGSSRAVGRAMASACRAGAPLDEVARLTRGLQVQRTVAGARVTGAGLAAPALGLLAGLLEGCLSRAGAADVRARVRGEVVEATWSEPRAVSSGTPRRA